MPEQLIWLGVMAFLLYLVVIGIRLTRQEKSEMPFADKVKCEECKCWLDKQDAYVVKGSYLIEYYCPTHKKPFSATAVDMVNFKVRYYREVEVTEDGTPVGYVKAEPKVSTWPISYGAVGAVINAPKKRGRPRKNS